MERKTDDNHVTIGRNDAANSNGPGDSPGAGSAFIYDARGNGEGGVSPTITGDHQNRITDYTAIVVEVEQNEDVYGEAVFPVG